MDIYKKDVSFIRQCFELNIKKWLQTHRFLATGTCRMSEKMVMYIKTITYFFLAHTNETFQAWGIKNTAGMTWLNFLFYAIYKGG